MGSSPRRCVSDRSFTPDTCGAVGATATGSGVTATPRPSRTYPNSMTGKFDSITHKGQGVSFMTDTAQWHGAVVDDESYSRARPELLAQLSRLEAAL